ncbi:WD-40protein [Angomonas deanei]|uniref:WD domain, G-beta repeat, putative n=1 Tax=Angomonas deanei TaxID=59799 RepID=A0A7G2CEG2_9TRYP|nr:WD-40protein [Angomonas deanei]CAD2218268.1 WD domain, G-beta repeat, putative [Angomonas deanei]|eukprot:EPY39325.1 WD-40protein [Angomonas deanei]
MHTGGRRRPRDDGQDDFVPRERMRGQRPVDFYSPAIRHIEMRLQKRRTPFNYHVCPHELYAKDVVPARETDFNPSAALCTQWVSTSFHPDSRGGRERISIFDLKWAPSGRRLLCSTSQGEFLLFNGQSFGLEIRTKAHEDNRSCRAIAWGARNDFILSGDEAGKVNLWTSDLVLVGGLETNHRAVREITWAPSEAKFCTAGQDGMAKVWDTVRVGSREHEEVKLEGHGGDVTTVHWHPYRALLATGSQDTQCRLWDPRTAASGSLASLRGHGQTVSCVRWHPDGSSLLTASKDGCAKLWDIRRAEKELLCFRGHSSGVDKVEWHPSVPDLFASTGTDGNVIYWMVDEGDRTVVHGVPEVYTGAAQIEAAHGRFRDQPNPIFCLAWSPLGNLLTTSGTEVKYWTRNKPGAMEEHDQREEDDILDEDVA